MAMLKNHLGQPLTDAAGVIIKDGSTVIDVMFGEGIARGVVPLRWSVPDGFQVADEPAKLDASLVDNHVYMRWEQFGWQLGKINGIIIRSTPRLFKQYNFRLVWADGSKGPPSSALKTTHSDRTTARTVQLMGDPQTNCGGVSAFGQCVMQRISRLGG